MNCSSHITKHMNAVEIVTTLKLYLERLWQDRCTIVNVLTNLFLSVGASIWEALYGSDDFELSEVHLRKAALELQEKEFHSYIRQQIVCLLTFIGLYLFSYFLISKFKSKSSSDALYSGDEDYSVYRISVWICTFSIAVSIGSVALLPFSILGAELLQRYPDNYYLQWLSWSLINSLWNNIFVLSNLSLFVLLPFSYFFIESQGFKKHHNGVMQRVYETLAVCALVIVVLLCLADVILTLLSSSVSLLTITSVNLPLIYSCVSLLGVVLLLISTPLGFVKIFSLVGQMLTTPPPDVEDDYTEVLEAKYHKWKMERSRTEVVRHMPWNTSDTNAILLHRTIGTSSMGSGDCSSFGMGNSMFIPFSSTSVEDNDVNYCESRSRSMWTPIKNFFSGERYRFWVELRKKSLRWYQHMMHIIKYPILITLLLSLTGVSLLMVVINTLKLVFGFRSLPVYAQYMEVQTRHTFGMFGVLLEIMIILYVMAISIVGLYSIPGISYIRPKNKNTSLTSIIINSSLLLIVSSALPVLANTLGITTFDLLGAYSALEWLSNFRLVLAYNVLFVAVTLVAIFTQLTSPVRKEILKRFQALNCGGSTDISLPEKLD